MFQNAFRLTVRNFTRQKGYSFINVFGLAIGMAAFVLIALFIQHELTIDRHLSDGDRLYRVHLDASINGQDLLTVSSPAVMGGAFIEAFPEVESALRLNTWSEALLSVDDLRLYEDDFYEADSTVFEFFDIELLKGDPATALARPDGIVFSEAAAERLFGEEDPMGRQVTVDGDDVFEVTGIFRLPTGRTHLRPEVMTSFLSNSRADDDVWLNNSFTTYIRLIPGASPQTLEAKFPDFQVDRISPQLEQFMGVDLETARAGGLRYDWKLFPVPDIYLRSTASDEPGTTGDIRYVYMLGIVAIFVLAIACINFMNLATARAGRRAREVGLRKVLGSDRKALVRQFLLESTVVAALAMLVGLLIARLTLPAFERLAGAELAFQPWVLALILAVTIVTGLLAGLYPALYLSRFQPATVLRGTYKTGRSGQLMRSGLVVFQFVISIGLLVGTLVVSRQLDFMRSQDLGYKAEQALFIQVETRDMLDAFPTLRDELLRNPNIVDAATGHVLPGPDHIHQNTVFRVSGAPSNEDFIAGYGDVSHSYVETVGLEIVAGRDFGPEYEGDDSNFIINEAAAAEMGLTPEEAVGKSFTYVGADRTGEIIGVVKDAHFESLRAEIRPLVLGGYSEGWRRYAVVRLGSSDVRSTLDFIEQKWSALQPDFPFQYTFLDADVAQYYEQEQRLGRVYTAFTTLAILIACLGLFGLASFVTAQRRKEIGVRKVLGASVPGIVALLSREFTILVGIACVIAFPISWFVMDRWLQGFAYATDIGITVFVVSAVAALAIAWLTVSWQSIRAATSNPVDAIRADA